MSLCTRRYIATPPFTPRSTHEDCIRTRNGSVTELSSTSPSLSLFISSEPQGFNVYLSLLSPPGRKTTDTCRAGDTRGLWLLEGGLLVASAGLRILRRLQVGGCPSLRLCTRTAAYGFRSDAWGSRNLDVDPKPPRESLSRQSPFPTASTPHP